MAPSAAPKREGANAALELQPVASAANAANAAQAKPAGAATAQAVFQAKAAPGPKAEGGRNLTMLWVIGGVMVFAILAIGGYVWWSLNSLTPQITTLSRRSPAPIAPTTPGASGPVTAPKLDTLVSGAIAPATPRSDSPAPSPAPAAMATTTVTSPSTTPAAMPRTEDASPAPRSSAEMAARLVREAPAGPPLRLAPTPAPRVPAEITAGYEALRNGDLNAARRSYTAAYSADPSSLDANLGLATVEARLGNVGAAATHYRRALDIDPGNATALAGLASMADTSQPDVLEQHLRADLARYPQSAALHFALGNLYASRRRWEEAQAAFFETLRLEPSNPEALYNLAVAMDHMGQPRLASDYYARALAAARGRNASFDPVQVERRISELRP
jgi:Tfp pilus assembly protein PilF